MFRLLRVSRSFANYSLHWLSILLVVVLLSLLWTLTVHSASLVHTVTLHDSSDYAAQVLMHTNDYRQQHGCPALTLHSQLSQAAQRHSDDMALNDFMSHTGSDGSSPWDRIRATGYTYRRAAENVAAGYQTPAQVVDGWYNSPGHRANMLNCELQEMGLGYSYRTGTQYTHYWAQVFGTPLEQRASPTAVPTATPTMTVVPAAYRVSGQVIHNGMALTGVTISDGTRTAMTDANGNYTLNVPAGSYTLTPSLSGYTFTPATRNVTVSADVSGQNFTATADALPTATSTAAATTTIPTPSATPPPDPTPVFTPQPAPTATAIIIPPDPDSTELLQAVAPDEGTSDQTTHMTVYGNGFGTAVAPTVHLRSTAGLFPLTEVTVLNATSFTANVPAGLPPGLYDLIVTSGGRTGTLPNAFSVLAASPVVSQVIPATGFNDRTTEMLVQGLNFADGAVVRLGTTPLDTTRINSTTLLAVVPAGLEAGAYTLTVANPDGGQVSLPAGFTVLDAADTLYDDLFSSSDQFWLNPLVPQAGQPVQLGLLVQRSGGKQPLEGVTVAFRRNSVDGPLLGTATIPFLDPVAGSESTTPLSVTFPTAGEVTLFAIIDPDNTVVESNQTNNIVQRTVVVAPAAADQTSPVVQGIAVNGGTDTTVTSRDLTLDIRASDPPPNASGVQDIHIIEYVYHIIEYVYNEGAQRWVPVAQSGWLPYTQMPDRYRWSLLPLPGMRYMQVRARDGAANVSIGNARRLINYEVPTDRIARGQTRIYRYTVAAGQELRVDLEVLSGDADLYVWSSDAQQSARVSNLPGTTNEQVIVPASEIVPGVYQVEVYGYSAAEYRLTTDIRAATASTGTLTSGGLAQDKPLPDAPVVPVSSVPDERAGSIPMTLTQPTTGQQVYLPLIVR